MRLPIDFLAPGIFRFPAFDERECEKLLALADTARDGEAPNSMNKYGVILDTARCRPVMRKLQQRFVEPIVERYYGKKLKAQPYAFLVEYEPRKQKSLAKHFDSSDFTLNICLQNSYFDDGPLRFYDKKGALMYEYKHGAGWGIMHEGSIVHRAMPTTIGRRANLIFWCATRR